MLFARRLSEHERDVLDSAFADRRLPPYIRTRLEMIKLSSQGANVPKIANTLGLDPITVRKWIRSFNERGFDPLFVRKRGGGPKPKFTPEQNVTIWHVARMEPRDLGLSYPRWSLRKLRAYLAERHLAGGISCERLRQVLELARISFPRRGR